MDDVRGNESYREAEEAFYSYCEPVFTGDLNEESKFEKILYAFTEELTKNGFNKGYGLGFQNGVMAILRLVGREIPNASDIAISILGAV